MSDLTCTITTLDQPPETVRAGGRLFVEISCGYHEGFIAALKEAVPASDRAWDETARRWYCTPSHLESVTALAAEHYATVWTVLDHGRVRREIKSGVEATQMDLFGGDA